MIKQHLDQIIRRPTFRLGLITDQEAMPENVGANQRDVVWNDMPRAA